ncbi:hypothetical protein OF83DRAFT_1273469, partial [Amylostereum chailletii]
MTLRSLRVLQLNVARSNVRMHAVLNSLTDFDILLLQEPWYGRIGVARSSTDRNGTDILGTVSNPAWEAFFPDTTADGARFRVATFVRRGIQHLAVRARPDIISSPDIMATSFQYGNISFILINVYNAGPGQDATSIHRLCDSEFDP